jgi:hypothetical protein
MNVIAFPLVRKLHSVVPRIVIICLLALAGIALIYLVVNRNDVLALQNLVFIRIWLILVLVTVVAYAVTPYFIRRFEEIGVISFSPEDIQVSFFDVDDTFSFELDKIFRLKFFLNETAADSSAIGLGNRSGINNHILFEYAGEQFSYQIFVKNSAWLKQFDLFVQRSYHGYIELYRRGRKVKRLNDF